MRLGADEVVAPDVVRPFGPNPHTGPVVPPQPRSWPLFLLYFQPLATPDALHPVLAHVPAGFAQFHRDPPITVAAIHGASPDDRSRQRTATDPSSPLVALPPAPLPQQPA